jgi:hypothetical protein
MPFLFYLQHSGFGELRTRRIAAHSTAARLRVFPTKAAAGNVNSRQIQ